MSGKEQNPNENTLKQLLKLKFITKTLLECNFHRTEEWESIQSLLSVIRVKEYLNLEEADGSMLNLGEYCENINLNYSALKIVRQELIANLQDCLKPIVIFAEKMKEELQHIYESPENNINASCANLLDLEAQRRDCLQILAKLKNDKVELLKSALELKLGSHVSNKLEILLAEMLLNQSKASLMHCYMINEFTTRSEHSVKAIKEVEGYIDKLLDEHNEELKCEKV